MRRLASRRDLFDCPPRRNTCGDDLGAGAVDPPAAKGSATRSPPDLHGSLAVQSILHPERMMLGTTGSPAGFLTTSPTPASEPENITVILSPRFTSATP